MIESDTPRTDASAVKVSARAAFELCEKWTEAVNADFARQLERELAISKNETLSAKVDCDVLQNQLKQAEAKANRVCKWKYDALGWKTECGRFATHRDERCQHCGGRIEEVKG